MPGRAVRLVTLCNHTTHAKGSKQRLWAFSRADLAALLGCSEATVCRLVAAGQLDPTDLESLARAWAHRHRGPAGPAGSSS